MSDEKKIFIDEGWKAQVQREKEEAARRVAEEAARKEQEAAAKQETPEAVPMEAAELPNAGAVAVPPAAPEALEDDDAPIEASFVTLVASLATQAMFALGVMAQPGAQQVMVNLDQAEFTIETLKVLQEKTRGNLSAEEEASLNEALNELPRLFAMRVQQFQEQAMKQGGLDPAGPR